MDIPRQPTGRALCRHCNQPITLRNRQLGPTWEHAKGSEWCNLTVAEPAHMLDLLGEFADWVDSGGAG